MLYSTQDEKELFKNIVPEINKIKGIFEKYNLRGTEIESNVVDAINNEIVCSATDCIHFKRLKNKVYKKYLYDLDQEIKDEIEDVLQKIKKKIKRFKKEYFEKT
ncbi:MAG: hypothetical protein ACLFUH_03320 [Bacteroidales bacterium]